MVVEPAPSLEKPVIISFLTLGLLMVIHPWWLAYSGTIFGVKLSLRSLGNLWGGLLIVLAFMSLLFVPVQNRLKQWAEQLDAMTIGQARRLAGLAALMYALAVASHKLKAHDSIGTHAFDLGFFSNICWNTAQGNFFWCSLIERNFLGAHVNWILAPLSIFYRWGGDARVLLIAQAAFVAAAVPFIWMTARGITGKNSFGLLFSLMFVCSPYISHHVSNDFHPDSWQLPCLTAALWAWHKGKKGFVVLFSSAALLAKEDVSLVLIGFSILLFCERRMRSVAIAVFLIAVAALFIHVRIVIPRFLIEGSESLLFGRYNLGDSYREWATNLIFKPSVYINAFFYSPSKFWRAFCMLGPAGGLALLSPLFLIPPAISLAPHIMSQASTQLQLADIYAIPTQPFIFVGSMMGFRKLQQKGFLDGKTWVLAAMGIGIAGFGVLMSPRYYRWERPERIEAFKSLRRQVPQAASVAAQQNLLPHFDTRRFIQLFPLGTSMAEMQTTYLTNPEYIVADRFGNALPYDGPGLHRAISWTEEQPDYETAFEAEGFLLFRRVKGEPKWDFGRGHFDRPANQPAAEP